MRMDTVIMGGGLSGLTCGIALAKRGQRVTIVAGGQSTLMVNGGAIGEYRLLYEDTVRLMQADQRQEAKSSVQAASDYGLFVAHVSPSGQYTWYGHQGRFNGITADIFWQPHTGLTFVMIVNGYDGALSTEGLAPIARRMMTLVEERLTAK